MKILIAFLLTILIIGTVSAWEIDNVKDFDSKTNTVSLVNAFGLGDKIEEATLLENSEVCSDDCRAEKTITIYDYGSLVDDVRFYRILDDGEFVEGRVRSYKLLYWGDVGEYTSIFKTIYNENGTSFEGTVVEKIAPRYEWIEFQQGQEFPAGTYQVRLEGTKRPDWSYDWQINLQGKWITEWATWGNISAGANAEIRLISPADKNITSINTVLYNASANVTNGATLTNMSLWTNSTGTWHRNQSVTGLTNQTFNNFTQGNFTQTNSAGDTTERGWKFMVNQNVTLTKVTRNAGSNAGNIILMYGNATLIQNSSVSSSNATFSANLIAGQTYILCNVAQGDSGWDAGATAYPYNFTYINLTRSVGATDGVSCTNGVTEENPAGGVREFPMITVSVASSSGVNFTTQAFSSVLPLNANVTWNVEACDSDGACGWNNASTAALNRTIWQVPAPSLTYNSPANNTNSTNTSMTFNVTVTDIGGGVQNVTLWINGTLYASNSSGYNGTYIFSQSLADGRWNWSVNASNAIGTTEGATRIFTLARTFETGTTQEAFGYETAQNYFYLNLTTNGSTPSNGKFIYNGTAYVANIETISSNVFNITGLIQIPLLSLPTENRTWFFNYTLNSVEYSTTNFQQNVSPTFFTEINSTYTNDFLNLSFQDEISLASINASVPSASFVYYLGNGTINKTYSYSNTTNNYNYTFAATPVDRNIYVLPVLQYKQGSDYPQRIWEPTIRTYNSSVYNQVLYLLNSVDGIFVTFQVTNAASQTIEEVDVNVTKTSDGSLVGSGATDDAGLLTFFLNPDIQQTVCFSKSGYETQCQTIFPTQTSYTVALTATGSTSTDYTIGISKTLAPSSNFLDQFSKQNFSYSLTSSYWTVESFEFRLYYANGTLVISNSSTANGGTITYQNFNVSNVSYLYMNYSYIVNGNASNFSRVWIIQSTTGRDYSFANFIERTVAYVESPEGLYGLDDFGRMFVSLAIIILVMGVVVREYGIQHEASLMSIFFGLVMFFDVTIEWIPRIHFGSITAIEHFPTFLTFIILLVFIIREERR